MPGRKRKFNPKIPVHIDQNSLPSNVHWCNTGKGYWFFQYFDEDTKKYRNKKIASRSAKLSDLHKAAESFEKDDKGTFDHLVTEFQASPQYKTKSHGTRKNYDYAARIVSDFPSKEGKPLGGYAVSRFTPVVIQKLIDGVHEQRGPTAGRHVLALVRRVIRWGNGRGLSDASQVIGLEAPEERKKRLLPEIDAFNKVVEFAKERGSLKGNEPGSVPRYLWPVLKITYLCRLRGIETITLTDANELEAGVQTNRRKGSRDNVVVWNDELREAWDYAKQLRQEVRNRHRLPTPALKQHRHLFLRDDNSHISRQTLGKAMKRLVDMAIDEGVITQDQYFTLHPVKRRGTTDTKGNRKDKQTATGHKSEGMLDIYDFELPEVNPAGE